MSTTEKEQVITINIDKMLMPVSIILSALVLAGGILMGMNNIAAAIKVGGSVAGTTTTGTGTTTGTVAVTQEQIKSLFTTSGNMIFGDANSKVLFVEFSDPSCPYCHIAAGKNPELNKQAGDRFILAQDGGTYVAPVEEMKKLVEQGQAAFVWMYSNGHGNGEMGTKALYCAYEKGKFWEAHDLLMTAEGYSLLNDNVKNDVSKAGVLADFLKNAVNSSEMQSCLESGKYDSRIASDQTMSTTLGVQGTPGFFVNTNAYPGAYNYTDMKSVVDSAL